MVNIEELVFTLFSYHKSLVGWDLGILQIETSYRLRSLFSIDVLEDEVWSLDILWFHVIR